MKTRLWKDVRHLLPIALIGGATGALAVHLPIQIAWWTTMGTFYATTILIGVLAFGHEYAHGCMAILLAQPISRVRIWCEKLMALVVVCAFMVATVFVVGSVSEMVRGWVSSGPYNVGKADGWKGSIDVDNETILKSAEMQYGPLLGRCIAWPAIWTAHFPARGGLRAGLPILIGDTQEVRPREVHRVWIVHSRALCGLLIKMAKLVCVGFWMGLLIRSPYTAFWAAAVIPFAYSFLVIFDFLHLRHLLGPYRWVLGIDTSSLVLFAIALIASRIQIQRMEV